jgi:hypothetical protein
MRSQAHHRGAMTRDILGNDLPPIVLQEPGESFGKNAHEVSWDPRG